MKSKKLFGIFATVMLLASCGGATTTTTTTGGTSQDSTDGTTSKPEGPFIKQDVTIEFWNTKGAPYDGVINAAIESFKVVEPHVTVKNVKQSVGIGQLQGVVTKGFSTGIYPDIVEGYPDHVSTYIDYEKVVNLDTLMNDSEIGWTEDEKADYVEAYIKEGQEYIVEGTYSLPFSKSTEILLYNKTLLDGIDLSSIDPTINDGRKLNDRYFFNLTWDEFFDKLCPALMKYNESLPADEKILDTTLPDYAILGYDSDDNLSITLAQQYGLPFTSLDREVGKGEALFNTPEMVDKINWISEMASKKYIMTQGGLGTYTNSLLDKRGVLFIVSSTGGLSHCVVKGTEIGAGILPQPVKSDTTYNKVISQGPSICLLKHDGADAELRQQASWLFYKHLTNFDNGLAWALNGGYSPIRHSVLESEEYLATIDVDNAGAHDSLNHLMAVANTAITKFQDYFYTTPAFKGSAECRTSLGGVMAKAVGAAMTNKALTRDQIATLLEEAWNQATLAINK